MVGCALIALVLGVGSARFAALTGQGLGAELGKSRSMRSFRATPLPISTISVRLPW